MELDEIIEKAQEIYDTGDYHQGVAIMPKPLLSAILEQLCRLQGLEK